jgi:hypothetical protein
LLRSASHLLSPPLTFLPAANYTSFSVFFFLQPGLHTTPREFTLRRKKRDN